MTENQPPPSDSEIDFWAQRVLGRLTTSADGALQLDLRGADRHAAEHAIAHMITRPAPEPRRVTILMDRPDGAGGESLFQPVGQLLKGALAMGKALKVRPISPENGLGFEVDLPANPGANAV